MQVWGAFGEIIPGPAPDSFTCGGALPAPTPDLTPTPDPTPAPDPTPDPTPDPNACPGGCPTCGTVRIMTKCVASLECFWPTLQTAAQVRLQKCMVPTATARTAECPVFKPICAGLLERRLHHSITQLSRLRRNVQSVSFFPTAELEFEQAVP